MSTESRENEGIDKMVKVMVEIPSTVHEKVLSHQSKIIGRKGHFVTIGDACADIIARGTKNIKVKSRQQ